MNLITKLTIASAIAASAAVAQTAPEAPAPATGLLGQRLVGAGFGFYDINGSGTDAFASGVTLNVPVSANVDLTASFSHAWVEGMSDISDDTLGAGATFYFADQGLKPFAGASVGYSWNDFDDGAVWAVETGVEYSLGARSALTLSAGYTDRFEGGSEGTFSATLGANTWLNEGWGLTADVSLIEGGDLGATAGVAFRF